MMIWLSQTICFVVVLTLSSWAVAVDINTASAEELAQELFNIGPVKGQRIVEYRQKIGGFRSVEQLMEVRGIGPKTLERNRDKLELSTIEKKPLMISPPSSPDNRLNQEGVSGLNHSKDLKSSANSVIETNLDLSPDLKKNHQKTHHRLWELSIMISLFVTCLVIFIVAWFKGAKLDKPVPRKHLISTTFVCAGCGKKSGFQNVAFNGHLSDQYIDGDLPPGWTCIKNWLGKPCDYCFDCSQKIHPDNY
jgi:competence protein ComEA